MSAGTSFSECTARQRLARLLDEGSLRELLPPASRVISPHLAALGLPCAFDDGVVIGLARLAGRPVAVAAQEGAFMGGGVGEVHGAKLVGLFRRAVRERVDAVLLLAESGGVRLHEANAGLIAVSEVMRALLDTRAAGIPVIVLIGGANGCFGGMGLVARCADRVLMSDVGRLAMSGPEVIEASHGVEEYDARDRALVWRTSGGKHRWLTGDCDALVEDDVAAFRAAAIASLDAAAPVTLASLQAEHALLAQRLAMAQDLPMGDEAVELWRRLGVAEPERVADREVAALRRPASIEGAA
ncbi:biotin-independent malonate decarboxylase subunit beta [Aquabacterium sp.]|uniref:biotin-independent malonate decarboxylase subunit beta n=1 Tax=Aquabacterium sp. TaxID=1872578 RepID=UPI00378493C3